MGRTLEQARDSPGRPVIRRQPIWDAESERQPGNKGLEIISPADGYGDISDRIFDDEIPADDPCNELPHRGIRVRIRASGDRDHRRELGVAERSEAAGDA